MASRRIVYVHGFNSAPQSIKGRLLGAAIGALGADVDFAIPALHHEPSRAIATLERELECGGREVTLVGSSLGGYYSTYLAERHGLRAVLVNPAIRPERDLASMLGPQKNLYTGEAYELTTRHFDELARYRVARISKPDRYLLLVQSGDEVLDWREAVRFYAGAWQSVQGGGSHGFEHFEHAIPTVLRFAGAGAPWPQVA